MGNLDHCFGSRSPSEFSHTRPSRNNILFLVNLRGAEVLSSSDIRGSMFFNWREGGRCFLLSLNLVKSDACSQGVH